MPLEQKGLNELTTNCNYLAATAGDDTLIKNALNAGADVILNAALENANGGRINVRTGRVLGSIRKSKLRNGKGKNGKRITIGVHRAQSKAFYANPVEFGHGGPHPAPPHPFIRPAYDENAQEAYSEIKDVLEEYFKRMKW